MFNIFIGANNVGKSSVLNFISKFLPLSGRVGSAVKLDLLERYSGGTAGPIKMQLGIPREIFVEAVLGKFRDGIRAQVEAPLEQLCRALAENDMIWLEDEIPFRDQLRIALADSQNLSSVLPNHLWNWLWSALVGRTGGARDDTWIPQTLEHLARAQDKNLPQTRLVPAIREIGPKSDAFADYSGRGLIDRLAELQSPDHDKRHERKVFDRINSFLQNVTDHPEAQIEVPHNREHILVHMDGRVLPLHSLGTGIQEVIMIAAFCTISEGQIVCVEEPELHLHPLLQRKLLEYLRIETTNQYFIATHSPAFIDAPDAAIFHVMRHDGQTVIDEAILRSERYAICVELGHKASDLLQSNAVVWVEGPSDRTYLQHWIAALAPELIEGIHYSIMFYGGRLLSHLTAEDDEVTEFIGLKALNRNVAILIDSDKARSSDKINSTKARLVSEFEKNGDIAWITKGREIENYIPYSLLQDAVKNCYGSIYLGPLKDDKYCHALHFRRSSTKSSKRVKNKIGHIETQIDKVKVAREVCRHDAVLDILDLRKRVSGLVEMIRKANN